MQEQPNQTRLLLTIAEFCKKYSVVRKTVYSRILNKTLQAVKKPAETGRGKHPQVYIIDPGWEKVVLHPSGKDKVSIDDVHVLGEKHMAALMSVTPRSIRRWASEGRLGFARIGTYGKGRRKYSINDLTQMMAMRATGKKHPSTKEKDETIMNWAKSRLEARQVKDQTDTSDLSNPT